VVAGRLAEDAGAVLHASAFRIAGAEVKPADAGKRDGRRAHRARLQRDVEIGAVEPLRFLRRTGLADRQHLGMRRRIGQLAHAVAGAGEDRAVGRPHDGPHRHLAAHARGLSLRKGRQPIALR